VTTEALREGKSQKKIASKQQHREIKRRKTLARSSSVQMISEARTPAYAAAHNVPYHQDPRFISSAYARHRPSP
jgi:hypothetical protein